MLSVVLTVAYTVVGVAQKCLYRALGWHRVLVGHKTADDRRGQATIHAVRRLSAGDRSTKGHRPTSLATVAWLSSDVRPFVYRFFGALEACEFKNDKFAC